MILEFIGNAPRTKFVRIGVKGNNLVDDLVFILGRKHGKVDLLDFTPKIKITTAEGDFAEYSGDDLAFEKTEERDTVKVTYTLPELVTEQGNVDMQLVFEKETADGVMEWQTLPFNVTFPDGIDESDSLIEAYPNIVRKLKADTKKAVDDSADAVSTANALPGMTAVWCSPIARRTYSVGSIPSGNRHHMNRPPSAGGYWIPYGTSFSSNNEHITCRFSRYKPRRYSK